MVVRLRGQPGNCNRRFNSSRWSQNLLFLKVEVKRKLAEKKTVWRAAFSNVTMSESIVSLQEDFHLNVVD